MTRRQDSLPPHALAAYLEREVTPSEAALIEAHVRDSGSLRRHLEQLDEIRRTLTRVPEPAAPDAAATEALWRAIDAAPVPGSAHAPWPRLRRIAALGAAACAALVALLILRGVPASEFRSKAAASVPDDRWVHIEVLRVDPDGAARPLPGRGAMHAGDRLVFRYANGGPDPFGFLMVFGVDAAGEIHWYYPAYEAAGSDPPSLPIQRSSAPMSLPDAIEHELAPGPLVFYAVFTRTALRVVDVEHRSEAPLAARGWDPRQPPRLPIENSGQHLVSAIVTP
jgi:hypothetical protein